MMSKLGTIGHRLYTGEISYDFIGHRRRWYILSAILISIAIISLVGRGLDFGIEFKGGADFKAPTQVTAQTVDSMREALRNSGVSELDEATVNTIGDNQIRVQTRTLDPTEEVPKVRAAIANEVGINPDQVAYSLIGASWGGQITERALIALAVFLVLVALVIGIYFRDAKMSAAALIALVHDVMLTIGIYALVGFTVTPATLIGLLTILGYSLYDTVVVFNQVLVRSINTTVIGVLPVVALLFAGAVILGEGPLKDLALALFVGMVSGAYSSIFIATPLLAQLKERTPDMVKLRARVASRREREGQKTGAPVRRPASTSDVDGDHAASPAAVVAATVPVEASSPPATGDRTLRRPQPQHKPRSQRKK